MPEALTYLFVRQEGVQNHIACGQQKDGADPGLKLEPQGSQGKGAKQGAGQG